MWNFSAEWYSFLFRFRRELETLETLRDSLQLEVDNSADLIRQKDKDIKAKSLKVWYFELYSAELIAYYLIVLVQSHNFIATRNFIKCNP